MFAYPVLFDHLRERIRGLQYVEEKAEPWFSLAVVTGDKEDFEEGKKILESLDYVSPSLAAAFVEALLIFGDIPGARRAAGGIKEFFWRVTALLKIVGVTREEEDIVKVVSELEQPCGCDNSYKPKFFLELGRVSNNRGYVLQAVELSGSSDTKRWLEFLRQAAYLYRELSGGV